MTPLLKCLHELVASESNAFFWVDEQDEITNFCAEKILPTEVMRLYFREFYNRPVGGFQSTIRQTATLARGIDRTTREPSFYQSDYYNLVWREHLNAHHAMYAVIQDHGRRLGQLSLYRTIKDKVFTQGEEDTIAQITHYIAYAITTGPTSNASDAHYFDTQRVGMIILNARGQTQHLSDEGKRLLFLASYPSISRRALLYSESDAAPAALKKITQYLHAIFSGDDAPPPVWHIENCWGRFVFRAFWLDAERGADHGLIGVTVQQQELLPLKLLRQLQTMGFSDKQKQVALMLADGASYGNIADRLHVTTNTANYHVKQIYDRMQVHNRNDLLNKFLAGWSNPGD